MTLEQQITDSLAESQSLVVQPAWPNRPEGEWMASIRTETRSGISGKGIHGKDREAAIANLHTMLGRSRDRCFPELTGDEEGFTGDYDRGAADYIDGIEGLRYFNAQSEAYRDGYKNAFHANNPAPDIDYDGDGSTVRWERHLDDLWSEDHFADRQHNNTTSPTLTYAQIALIAMFGLMVAAFMVQMARSGDASLQRNYEGIRAEMRRAQ